MRKVIIEVRANERADRKANRNVPWTPVELAADGKACIDAGAAIYHFHARSAEGESIDDYGSYRDTIAGLRSVSDGLIHPSLGDLALAARAADRYAVVLRLAAEGLAADLAPVGMAPSILHKAPERELLAREGAEDALRRTILDAVALLRGAGITPYFDCWNRPALRRAVELLNQHRLGPRPFFMLSMLNEDPENPGFLQPATLDGLRGVKTILPAGKPLGWAVLSARNNLLPLVPGIVDEGGHISIGLGDYPYPELGLPTNAGLVGEVVRLVRAWGCEPASPAEARAMLGA